MFELLSETATPKVVANLLLSSKKKDTKKTLCRFRGLCRVPPEQASERILEKCFRLGLFVCLSVCLFVCLFVFLFAPWREIFPSRGKRRFFFAHVREIKELPPKGTCVSPHCIKWATKTIHLPADSEYTMTVSFSSFVGCASPPLHPMAQRIHLPADSEYTMTKNFPLLHFSNIVIQKKTAKQHIFLSTKAKVNIELTLNVTY